MRIARFDSPSLGGGWGGGEIINLWKVKDYKR